MENEYTHNYKILIASHTPTYLNQLQSILSSEGFNIITTEDGEKAVELIIRQKPELIILEWTLPLINGFEICRDLKNNRGTNTTPIMLIKSKADEEDLDQSQDIGTDEYLIFPIHKLELQSKIRHLLHIKYDFLKMSHQALKEAILLTFTKDSSKSFKKDNLLSEVLRLLRVITRESPRKRFGKKLNHALQALKNQDIVEEYSTKKNKRLRIIDHQKAEMILRQNLLGINANTREPEAQAEMINEYIGIEKSKYISAVDDDPLNDLIEKKKIRIPDLPEENYNKQEQEGAEIDEASEISFEENSEKNRLISIFTGEKNNSNVNDLVHERRKEEGEILQDLNEIFARRDWINTEVFHRGLILKVALNNEYINLSINFVGLKKDVIIKAFVPYFEEALTDILTLYSRADYIGSVCIEDYLNQPFFVIKRSIDLLKFSLEDLVAMIDQIISESMDVLKVIERYS